MEKAEVIALCKRLNAEHPQRRAVQWLPRELSPGDWVVSRVERASRRDATRSTRALTPPRAIALGAAALTPPGAIQFAVFGAAAPTGRPAGRDPSAASAPARDKERRCGPHGGPNVTF